MDSRVGLDYIVENVDYTQKLATALDTENIAVKKQIFELLSALCVYSTDGYTRALETLQHFKTLKKQRYRFQLVVDELRASELVEYTTALVAFLNCVIISEATLKDRIRVRNEFLGLKILEVLDQFRKQCKNDKNPELALQLDVFDEQRSTDEGQFSGPDGVDLSSHMDVFFAILRQVAQTPQELPFLSILQHLLRTDINQPLSEVVWDTAETLVHRATLLESKQESDRLLRASSLGGLLRCHCSCHYRSTVDDDGLSVKRNRPNHLPLCSTDGARTPSLIVSPNQHHSTLTPCDSTSSPLFCVVNEVFRSPNKGTLQKENFTNEAVIVVKQTEVSPNQECSITNTPHNNPTQHSVVTFSGSVQSGNKNPTKQQDISCSPLQRHPSKGLCIVPAISESETAQTQQLLPPPPPPPPPPPFALTGNSAIPPPPPPPPLSNGFQTKKIPIPERIYLPQQNTPKPKTKMKSFNWSKIPASKVVGRDNLWSRVANDHSGIKNDLDFEAMEGLFCQQLTTNGYSSPKFGSSPQDSPDSLCDKKKREIQEINLLDGKRSLNINIFLKQFRSSHQEIVRILQEGAHEELGAERLRGLLKILPEDDEVEMLKNFDGEKTKLGNAEKFLLQLIDVPNYRLRIESMLLKEEFLGSQEFLETSIETIRCAAQEIEECKKLHEILYMVVVAGNFLNAGGYAGDAAGFKILSLLKLTDIRANKPSMTLIHYVAEQTTKKKPELLTLLDEVRSLEEASKISIETLKTDMSSLSQRVTRVSSQVAAAEPEIKSQMQDFLQYAENKVDTIQNDINNLENVRHKLEGFLCEDKDTFKLEECFKVFHNFCTRFKAAVQENEKRQQQEKLAEARRKQREEQIALKRKSLELSDTRSNGDVDHIMDQLLGDIRSGFPERRLGEIYKRNKRNCTDSNNLETLSKNELNALKRHSDPSMTHQVDLAEDRQDRSSLGIVRQRRARFAEESDELIGYLRNPSENDPKLINVDDGGLDRGQIRRSGRRKRELMNNRTPPRERAMTSPPPAPEDDAETGISSKQKLRAKINDWFLQNELEQQRDKELQLKKLANERLRKHLVNGHSLTVNGDSPHLANEEVIEHLEGTKTLENNLTKYQNGISGISKETTGQCSTIRQSDNFTQKIIGLLDAVSSEKRPFERTRLYHSTKELGSRKYFDDPKIKDETELFVPKDKPKVPTQLSGAIDNEHIDNEQQKHPQVYLSTLNTDIQPINFDRNSSTRKTQRRMKLKEMRLEGENKLKQRLTSDNNVENAAETEMMTSSNSPTTESLTSNNSDQITDSLDSSNPNEDSSQHKENVEHVEESELRKVELNNIQQNDESIPIQSDPSSSTDSKSFLNRSRNTSLRSRQSRLARRIDSLTTPVTSPSELKIVCESDPMHEEQQKNQIVYDNNELLKTGIKYLTPGIDDDSVQNDSQKENNIISDKKKVEVDRKCEDKSPLENYSKPSTSNEHTEAKSPKTPDVIKANPSNKIINGKISHKITVSTETKSKVTIPNKVSASQTQQTHKPPVKPNLSIKNSATNIPGIFKATQNIKVSQTIQTRPRTPAIGKKTGIEIVPKFPLNKQQLTGSKSSSGSQNSASPKAILRQAQSVPKKTYTTTKAPDKTESVPKFNIKRTGKYSTANGQVITSSSISSLNSLNANEKLAKTNGNTNISVKAVKSNLISEKKITINHNGAIRLNSKSNIDKTITPETNGLKHLPTKCSTVSSEKKGRQPFLTRKAKIIA